jgi:heme/copper-type cytochrome/quinol oxidase subunit 3
MISVFIIFAVLILYYINTLTNALCIQKEIPEEKQPKIFQTINILITILLISSYVEILFSTN